MHHGCAVQGPGVHVLYGMVRHHRPLTLTLTLTLTLLEEMIRVEMAKLTKLSVDQFSSLHRPTQTLTLQLASI